MTGSLLTILRNIVKATIPFISVTFIVISGVKMWTFLSNHGIHRSINLRQSIINSFSAQWCYQTHSNLICCLLDGYWAIIGSWEYSCSNCGTTVCLMNSCSKAGWQGRFSRAYGRLSTNLDFNQSKNYCKTRMTTAISSKAQNNHGMN